ncbi:hypothetical protein V5O48_010883 [Marasmius crinis-equi]|uniref:F-box domain-containing protein n=1 Tax=Marasmius crinis-equi TaxID=585013 RepID=A0ABR3F750_9AGAR
MATLDRLSAELLSEILELIHDSSRHTIFSLLRVNRAISGAALPFAYRECTFNFSQNSSQRSSKQTAIRTPLTRSLEKLASLLEAHREPDSAIWRGVRKVVVHSDWVVWEGDTSTSRSRDPPFTPSEELVQARWGSFVEFLSRVVNLREVVFDCRERVPLILLNALEKTHPCCRLHVKDWTRLRSDARAGDPYEEALARSPCLSSLEARFTTGGYGINFKSSAIERILALSPNLEAMSCTTYTAGSQCVVEFIDAAQFAEADREREKFVVANPVRKSEMRRIRYSSLSSGLIRSWERLFDPRKVETLNLQALDNTEWMGYASDNGLFGGLKHLSFTITHDPRNSSQGLEGFKAGLADFLDSCFTLESLSVVGYHRYIDLLAVLDRHGETLRSLALHQAESIEGSRPSPSRGDLDLIRSRAPRLESLEVDVNRTIDPSRNELEIYSVISSFPDIRHLAISYDLGVHYEVFHNTSQRSSDPSEAERYLKTYIKIDEDFAREIWRTVRGKALEEMVIYDGEQYRETEDYWPCPFWVEQEVTKRQRFWLTRNERDDLKDVVSAVKVVRKGRSVLPPLPEFLLPSRASASGKDSGSSNR